GEICRRYLKGICLSVSLSLFVSVCLSVSVSVSVSASASASASASVSVSVSLSLPLPLSLSLSRSLYLSRLSSFSSLHSSWPCHHLFIMEVLKDAKHALLLPYQRAWLYTAVRVNVWHPVARPG